MKIMDRLPGQLSSPELRGDTSSTPHSPSPEVSESKWERKKIHLLKKTIAFLVIIGIFYLLGKNLYENFAEISHYQWSIKYDLLILSFLFLVVNLSIASYAWKKILSFFRDSPSFGQTFKIMSVSTMGKYIPGKVWQYLGQIYLSQKVGLPKSVTFFSMILLFIAYNLAGILIFLFSLFFWHRFSPYLIFSLLVMFALISLVIFYPPVLNKVLKILTQLFKREALTIKARFDQIIKILMILILDWLIFGVSLYFLINSFYSINFNQTVILCGIFAIAVISGILSFFVPAGLGVREGVQSYLLSLFIPVSMAILISLVMRVWIVLGELICFLIALKIKKPTLT
jgi:uncharacterized membrane protein YbhN (UPF0104 family)